MTGQRLIIAAGVVALAGCGGGSELRRALNDIIDQREAGAAEQAAVYESFDTELTEELMAEWGVTPEGGCPELEDLPAVGMGLSMSLISGTASAADRERREETRRARQEAWVRNVPAHQCRCLQGTILNVRNAAAGLADPGRFDEEREQLAELTEEELPLAAPMLRGTADQYSAERGQARVERWESQRYGEDGESGWQSAGERDENQFAFMACDSFF